MMLRIFILIIVFLSLVGGAYFSHVQDLIYKLPGVTEASSGRASGFDDLDPSLDLIPKPDDWIDFGRILEAGGEGEWDFLFAGITPASLVKKDDLYYFYYVGADGYRSFDGGPRHRSIGVATSPDGINYQKHSGNPIMTHRPLDGEEEGANSAGITLDEQGNFVMYYGGAIGKKDLINANGRLAISEDGFNFTDRGIVLNRLNPFLYGFGDEIFPVAVFEHKGRWNVYYQPNGARINNRNLGMVWGNRLDRLPRSAGVLDKRSGGNPVITWGNINWLAPDRIALFIQRLWWPDTFLEVRTASPDAPHRLSDPVVRYDIPNLKHGTVFLDSDRRTWFMIYNNFDRFWRLKLAPAGEPDTTPPNKPANLQAQALEYDAIQLSWEPAEDPETGVVHYKIYRDEIEIGSTTGRSFTETDLLELSQYTYEVSAVNFHGYEGRREVVSIETPADRVPPQPVSTSTQGNPLQLIVAYDEQVDKTSAEDISNYSISPEIQVEEAILGEDVQTVTLVTSPHAEEIIYTLSVSGILDQAESANILTEQARLQYIHHRSAGLAGSWNLDEARGSTARDLSGFGNDGVIVGAKWVEGVSGSALQFDGVDDYVIIEDQHPLDRLTSSSFTFSAWVHPEDRPTGRYPYGILARASVLPDSYFGLAYDKEGRFRGQVFDTGENLHVLVSSPIEPGNWSHLAMAVDMDSSLLHLYIDGKPVKDSPMSISGELMNLGIKDLENYFFGEYYIGSTKPDLGGGSFFTAHFKGLIKGVRIYNSALNEGEIQCLVHGC
jgi:hypothetical protein